MKSRSLALAVASAWCLLCASAPALAANKKASASATLKLVATSATPNTVISWTTSKLHFQGRYYDLVVDGVKVTTLGITSLTAVGRIYHMSKLEDLEGHYVAAAAGSQIGGGAQGFAMKNQNGVEIYLNSSSRGISLAMGSDGVQLTLKK
ncbi:MAG TPA: hypothetical protein VEN47_03465 [Myxococcota bacterium]|nr:hypothetical protein [Myxococcota bacterium]